MELKAFFFKTLYHWMVAYDCFCISSFQDFLYFFFFLISVFIVYFLCTLVCALLRFNKISITCKEKKDLLFHNSINYSAFSRVLGFTHGHYNVR